MKLQILVDLDNDSFELIDNYEVRRLLRELEKKLRVAPQLAVGARYPLIDTNGNTVGTAEVIA